MFDYDRNGKIDFNEFYSLWKYVTDWTNTFRSYDLNNDGSIDKNELSRGLFSEQARTHSNAQTMKLEKLLKVEILVLCICF